jgi:sugar phosphate isomerase/epimerase
MGVSTMALHAGFISEDTESDEFAEMVDVLREVSRCCKERGLNLNLETGQESAETLLEVLDRVDMDNLGVNFDPANMVLYGSGEPLPALRRVGGHVRSCHCKDAVWSDRPGETWGEEVPLGEGAVDMEEYVKILDEFGYDAPLTIEREIAPPQQIEDMKKGVRVLRSAKEKLGIS